MATAEGGPLSDAVVRASLAHPPTQTGLELGSNQLGVAVQGTCNSSSNSDVSSPSESAKVAVDEQRKGAFVFLLGGASGSGKSTLAVRLANAIHSKYGLVCSVISSDTVRHVLRSQFRGGECRLLFASTYNSAEFIKTPLPASVTEKLRWDAVARFVHPRRSELRGLAERDDQDEQEPKGGQKRCHAAAVGCGEPSGDPRMDPLYFGDWGEWIAGHDDDHHHEYQESGGVMTPLSDSLKGYYGQSRLLYGPLSEVVVNMVKRGESVVVEGVHLTAEFLQALSSRLRTVGIPNIDAAAGASSSSAAAVEEKGMRATITVMPFLLTVEDSTAHALRFATRSQDMSVDPQTNKYIKNLENIRCIDENLRHAYRLWRWRCADGDQQGNSSGAAGGGSLERDERESSYGQQQRRSMGDVPVVRHSSSSSSSPSLTTSPSVVSASLVVHEPLIIASDSGVTASLSKLMCCIKKRRRETGV